LSFRAKSEAELCSARRARNLLSYAVRLLRPLNHKLIKARGLKQAEAGKILGIKQPHVSALMRNRSGSLSVERLMEFLTLLGQDVEITVRPTRKQHGELSVLA